jgi:uncharacterized membrane protein YgdD (TMEM256/DUF423 family)
MRMNSLSRRWIAIGALLAALGVGLGAYGAHGLGDFLASHGHTGDDLHHRLAIFDTAIRYQMLHALALVFIGLALEHRSTICWRLAAWAFLVGIILFCGLLKVLTFADPSWKWLGAIVPLGGASMIAGWIAVAVGALRR